MNISGAGNVGIGTLSPSALLDISGSGTNSAIIVPRATIAQRPTTAVNGMIRYQLDTQALEAYINGAWSGLATTTSTGAYLPLAGGTMTGAIVGSNGTAALPAYAFVDKTTGLYSTGAGGLTVATAGAARMSFDSAGNVGIGTTSPSGLLSAYSGTLGTAAITFRSNANGIYPTPATLSGAITSNFSSGGREVNFWNTDTSPPTLSFNFLQMTGTGGATTPHEYVAQW